MFMCEYLYNGRGPSDFRKIKKKFYSMLYFYYPSSKEGEYIFPSFYLVPTELNTAVSKLNISSYF